MIRSRTLDAVAVRFISGTATAHINTTRADLLAAGVASAIETAKVSWARPHGLGHAEPSHAQLVVICSTGQLQAIRWDARVEVDVTEGGTTTRVIAGWITGYNRTLYRRGKISPLYRVAVTVEDVTARLAALLVGDTPWPAYQLANDRLARIGQLTGGLVTAAVYPPSDPSDQKPTCGPRDVDRVPALDLVESCAVPGWVTAPTNAGRQLTLKPVPGTSLRWPAEVAGGYIFPPSATPGGAEPVAISANQIGDVPRTLDRTAAVNRVAWTHTKVQSGSDPATAELVTGTDQWLGDTGRAAGEIAWSSDVLYTGNPVDNPVPKLAARVLAENATPTEALEGAAPIYQMPSALMHTLIDVDRRALTTINITDRPPDVEQFQRVVAGTLTIERGQLALALTMQPARLSGLRPARISDAPTGTAGRIREMGQLRISDMTLTAH